MTEEAQKRRSKRSGNGAGLTKATEKSRQVASSGKVGKGKPPEAFKWKPGQSGNPSGMPSAHREVIVASVRAMLAQVDPKLNKSLFERLLEQCARRALQGSKWHMGVLLDYGLGKPTQVLEHLGKDGNPLETLVKVIHIRGLAETGKIEDPKLLEQVK